VRDAATEELIADLVNEHDEVVAVDGGTGGRGNAAFASATNQAPREYEVGTPGEEREVLLELKLLADVGLVGFPNAGKSTLIAAISAAKPKIADYPFTTLVPNLGIVQVDLGKSFVVADIPGLIEGAHAGKGLGIQFLRHIERTRFLVFLLDANADNPKGDYRVLLNELKLFDPTLLKKPRLIALTKIDAVDETVRRSLAKTKFPGADAFLISAVARTNLRDLVGRMWKEVTSKKRETLSITSSKKTRRRKKTKVTPLRRRWD
jgi:GTP-binding protein